jgi:hypothetical protein
MIRELRKRNDRALGVLQTTWCDFAHFIRAYHREKASKGARGTARHFKTLFAAIGREKQR